MADRFVDDGGDNSDGTTWAKAYTSLQSLQTAESTFLTTSGNRAFIGADSNCTDAAAALTITGPTSGSPVIIISSTAGTGTTVSYAAGTGDQILATGSVSDVVFDGSFALYGIRIKAGRHVLCSSDANEMTFCDKVTFVFGPNGQVSMANGAQSRSILRSCVLDLSEDGTTGRANSPLYQQNAGSPVDCFGITSITNAGYRVGTVLNATSSSYVQVNGCDFSGFTNASCELVTYGGSPIIVLSNILTAASFTLLDSTAPGSGFLLSATNVGPADAPTSLAWATCFGSAVSATSIYRSGGATVEGDACSWLITTTATCAEGAPFYTPWIYGTVGSTGSKTFDLYITNDTADFTDAEAWLEVEYLSTADEAIWALATDQRATITTTAAAQTDDTTSTWNGTGPSFTYKQKLSVTATIGETGQYRARVAVGVASIAGSRYLYCDPKVTVS